jgi:hypothetical protein
MSLANSLRTFVIAALASLLVASVSRADMLFDVTKPPGGNTGIHDIREFLAVVNGSNVDFTVRFYNTITDSQGPNTGPNDIFGFLDIDADKNPATGLSNAGLIALRSFGTVPGLGVDFYADLFQEQPGSPDLLPLVDQTGNTADQVPIVYGADAHSLTVSVPWTDLGFSSATAVSLNAAFLAVDDTTRPNQPFVSDSISNLAPVPEPGSLVLMLSGTCALAGRHRQRLRRVLRFTVPM